MTCAKIMRGRGMYERRCERPATFTCWIDGHDRAIRYCAGHKNQYLRRYARAKCEPIMDAEV